MTMSEAKRAALIKAQAAARAMHAARRADPEWHAQQAAELRQANAEVERLRAERRAGQTNASKLNKAEHRAMQLRVRIGRLREARSLGLTVAELDVEETRQAASLEALMSPRERFANDLAKALDGWTSARVALDRIREYVLLYPVDTEVMAQLSRLAAGLLEAKPELGADLGNFAHSVLTSCLAALVGIDARPGAVVRSNPLPDPQVRRVH